MSRRLSLEPALLVALGARLWQSLAGLLTLYIVVTYFDPRTQGYYQIFLSLVALQWFVELGVMVAIISIVSHEWAHLKMTPDRLPSGPAGTISRLGGISRFVLLWFAAAALVLLVGGGSAGVVLLARQGGTEVWLLPWLSTITMACLFLFLQGFLAVVEGCSQVLQVASYRLTQAVVGSLALWGAVVGGAGLWSLAIMTAANVGCVAVFLGGWYRRFLWSLLQNRAPSTFRWRTDVWPMQWPLALQGATGYFVFSLFVPVIYAYHGVVEAGRMGISLQVVMAILGIATTFLTVKAPQLGAMYARKEVESFERVWRHAGLISFTAVALGIAVVGVLLWIGAAGKLPEAERFLAPLPFGLLLVWGISLNVNHWFASYWRAQRREAVGLWGIVPGLVTGPAIWLCGRALGSAGAAGAALVVAIVVSLPIGIYFLRASWRRTRVELAPR